MERWEDGQMERWKDERMKNVKIVGWKYGRVEG